MTEEKLGKIHRAIRIAIFAIPVLAIVAVGYLILFPIDIYRLYSDNPNLSKFEIRKNTATNEISFGVFPVRDHRFVELRMNFKKDGLESCQPANIETAAEKTYQAYLYPTADVITDQNRLKDLLFSANKTKYPNGSLLHLKPTNEVFFISRGKKILFPGPEIFQAFGYSFDNLTDVEQSDIDRFSDADQRVFLWTMPHPEGTIFQSFPSHALYLALDGKKYPIADESLLEEVWPEFYAVPVSDPDPANRLGCPSAAVNGRINCRFDSTRLSGIGRYFLFTLQFPDGCPVENLQAGDSQIRFISEKSIATMKESARNIAASVLNRYFYKE